MLEYGERPPGKGLYFCDNNPGMGIFTGYAASGAQLLLFQLGGGGYAGEETLLSPSPGMVAPLLWATANPKTLANAKNSIDFYSGGVLGGEETIDEAADALLRLVVVGDGLRDLFDPRLRGGGSLAGRRRRPRRRARHPGPEEAGTIPLSMPWLSPEWDAAGRLVAARWQMVTCSLPAVDDRNQGIHRHPRSQPVRALVQPAERTSRGQGGDRSGADGAGQPLQRQGCGLGSL